MRSIRQLVMSAILVVLSIPAISQTPQGADRTPEHELALKLEQTKNDDEVSLLISGTSVDKSALANELLDEANRQRKAAPAPEIERIARIGLRLADLASDKKASARAWLLIGNSQSDDAERFASYKKGLEAAKEVSADELVVKLAISIGQLQMGTKDEEIEWYRSALENAERLPAKYLFSDLLGRIGNAYAQNGNFDIARDYHARSLEIKKATNDVIGIANTTSNLGIIYGMQGDSIAAREQFERSLAILETLTEKEVPDLVRRKAKDLRNLGIVAGDSWHALEYYLRSLKLSEDANYKNGVYGASFQIASLYNGQGDYELARQFLRRGAEVTDDSEIPAEMMGILGDSYMGEGRYDKAIEAYLKQHEDVMKHEGGDAVIDSLMHLGNSYLAVENVGQAEAYFNKALQKARESKNDLKIFVALEALSRSRLMAKDFKAAIDLAEQAEAHRAKLRGARESWSVYATLGSANVGLGRPEVARANFEKAVALIDKERTQTIEGSTKKSGPIDPTLVAYHQLIALSAASKNLEAAFTVAERAKASRLLEVLTQGRLNISGAMTSDEKKAERRLKNELSSLAAQIESERNAKVQSPDRLAGLERQLTEKRHDFESFRDRLYIAHPELRIQRGEMTPISMTESAGLLSDTRSALAEFVVAQEKTFLFAITKSDGQKPSVKAYEIGVKSKDIATKVEAYRTKLAAGDLDFQDQSRELYDLLLKPAAAELAGKTNIIIVPDGPLWNLPFQTLQPVVGKFLIEQSAVSYAPSLTALREMHKKVRGKRTSDGSLLAFGNPAVNKATSDRLKTVFMDESLEPLPEAERLVNELGKMYGPLRSKVFTGTNARESTAKAESPKYRIVQFATHGILNNVSPMYSHLVLSQKQDDPNEDGLLEAWELKDLDLRADMVILSACDTARGKIANGEGVIGMTWSAFIAGAPTTVASQWKVESSSTTELMLEFHRQLLTGKVSKSEALRRAELKLLRTPRYKHPFYWAPFVVMGDGS